MKLIKVTWLPIKDLTKGIKKAAWMIHYSNLGNAITYTQSCEHSHLDIPKWATHFIALKVPR